MKYYQVKGPFTSTFIACKANVKEAIEKNCSPYLSFKPISAHSVDNWLVKSDDQSSQGWPEYTVTPLGEVDSSFALHVGEKVLVSLSPQTDEWQAQNILRYTRAIHKLDAQQKGAIFLHGGLVKAGGLGVALLGESKSGKTTTTLSLLKSGGVDYVSNDDISVKFVGDDLIGLGWPRSISVRLDSFDAIEEGLLDRVKSQLTHPANNTLYTLKEQGIEKYGTAIIYAEELAKIYECKFLTEAAVDVFILPSFDYEIETPQLTRLDSTQAINELQNTVLENVAKYSSFLESEFNPINTGSLRSQIELIAKQKPVYTYKQNFNSMQSNTVFLLKELERLHK